ncbi:MAG: hypothetical protein QMC85_04440 [Methanocellales archaeon]|nr:hypothetical protein [Methanocellales archaeon]
MRKDDLRGLASEIGYSREDAWKHAVLIKGNNLASFGAKLTMTGAVAPLFLCSRGPALHAAEKYVRDFGIPGDEDGIPYFVKINSTLIRNPSQTYKKRGKYSWDTLMCPYGLFVLQSGSELICEICRGYTVGWTSYVLTGGEKCTYQFHEGKEQLGVDYHIAKTISAEQVMKHLIKNQELLSKLIHEIAGLASLVGGKEYLDEEEQCKAFIDYAVGAANDVLGTLTSAIIVNASAIIGKELVGRYCREVGASVMEIALSGMPPLYIGWDERDMGTLEKLLAVYSASLDLPATF